MFLKTDYGGGSVKRLNCRGRGVNNKTEQNNKTL